MQSVPVVENQLASIEIYFCDVFDIDPADLEAFGAFNISLVNDLPLFYRSISPIQ